jgi:hypothetical protein
MALLTPNQGEAIALGALLNKTAPQDLDLCLYKNDYTPVEGTTEANVTAADFTGYSVIQLTAASWTITEGAPTSAAYAQQTFTSSAGSQNQPIYGYYIKQRTSGKLVWAERFSDGPYTITNNGDNIKITPTITCD